LDRRRRLYSSCLLFLVHPRVGAYEPAARSRQRCPCCR
jgi:hypothetical protein